MRSTGTLLLNILVLMHDYLNDYYLLYWSYYYYDYIYDYDVGVAKVLYHIDVSRG